MKIIYSDITYEEAEKFWRKQGNAMHDRRERLLKTISRMVEMVCGLAVLVYVGVTWKTKILPEAARINRINIVKNNLLFFIRIIFCKPPKKIDNK